MLSVSIQFADSVRHEVGGQTSVIGIYEPIIKVKQSDDQKVRIPPLVVLVFIEGTRNDAPKLAQVAIFEGAKNERKELFRTPSAKLFDDDADAERFLRAAFEINFAERQIEHPLTLTAQVIGDDNVLFEKQLTIELKKEQD